MNTTTKINPNWWRCPNNPRCLHGSILHDIEDYDDPSPTCCVEGCGCGQSDGRPGP